MIQEAIGKVVEGVPLSAREAETAMAEIMQGQATPAQIAGLVIGLRMKGETPDEVHGFAQAMRRHGVRLAARRTPVTDTCGTGGDGKHTLNISTGAALVAAGTGLAVAKHGNRAMSSKAGSADVLESLGVKVDAAPPVVQKCLDETGICFCFAPVFHPAMKHAGPPRKEMGVRTIFNVLGPLTNPAGASVQIIGVARKDLLELEARALAKLGTGRSLVVHSRDGLDELTTTAQTRAILVQGHSVVRRMVLNPRSLGFKRATLSDLAGGSPQENAAALKRVLKGEKGAFRDSVIFNAAAVCWLAKTVKSVKAGAELAAQALDSGAALSKLERLAEASNAGTGQG